MGSFELGLCIVAGLKRGSNGELVLDELPLELRDGEVKPLRLAGQGPRNLHFPKFFDQFLFQRIDNRLGELVFLRRNELPAHEVHGRE